MAILLPTPSVLRDLYVPLEDRQKEAFLQLIAGDMPAEMLFFMVHCLSVIEQRRFTDMVHKGQMTIVSNLALGHAIDLIREQPTATSEELVPDLREGMQKTIENIEGHVHTYEAAKLKQLRDRGRSRKNVAIRNEAMRLKESGQEWRQIAEAIWTEHPEWFPADERPEQFRDKPAQQTELLSRLKERIRDLCKSKKSK